MSRRLLAVAALMVAALLPDAAPAQVVGGFGGRSGTTASGARAATVSTSHRVDISADSLWAAGARGIGLTGHAWRFRLGDEMAWTSPGYYDGDWQPIRPGAAAAG